MPSKLILQKNAALVALRVKRGEKPIGTLDSYAKQLYDNLTEFTLGEITLGRITEIFTFPKPTIKRTVRKTIPSIGDEPLFNIPVETKIVKGKIKKKKTVHKKKVETDNE